MKSAEMSPLDICDCGDFRRDHVDGTGRCTLNGLGHGGAPSCDQFRLSPGADDEFNYWNQREEDDRDEA